jgi:hypothetical protein
VGVQRATALSSWAGVGHRLTGHADHHVAGLARRPLAGPSCSTPVISTPLLDRQAEALGEFGRQVARLDADPAAAHLAVAHQASITWRAVSTGIAKPMPRLPPLREKMAVLMPTRCPCASTSAPPELPGLMAASVWMKFSKVLTAPAGCGPAR